ncbi:hypothetical protein G7B40_027060 [Aetokthonos hydrillicola Thurmond2011]|jgi:hypothetical protein|uniref:Uncharacterized protein n=1 Tax=Aetokthonos hydrillicola Thurmond2011 TaxID=2712845 RepID=A0AAP5ID96_9CYAN|nr:hypothetical protein [Aetokthonos hydrillicola]MBO3462382.1 hypothetical protein [Aetokthonos hydrillicola CCALA 1050]MBW4590392.1 hypothetical protein [Aetokthonos hydrillicola CCALA 1050]MDR9898194.1 hypothetical protein [Aetokthonos hydrillicola Thurmond2011]
MLNISLDDEIEKYLVEILAHEKTTSNELIKRLLVEHWQSLQPRKTILERMGGYPENLLNGPSDLSDRDKRYKYLAEHFQRRYEESQQKQQA